VNSVETYLDQITSRPEDTIRQAEYALSIYRSLPEDLISQDEVWHLCQIISDDYLRQKETAKAEQFLLQQLSLPAGEYSPIRTECLNRLSKIYYDQKRNQECAKLLTSSIGQVMAANDVQNGAIIYFKLGTMALDRKEMKALGLNKDTWKPRCMRLMLLALGLLQRFQDKYTNQRLHRCFKVLAHLYEDQGNLQQAIEYNQRILSVLRSDRPREKNIVDRKLTDLYERVARAAAAGGQGQNII